MVVVLLFCVLLFLFSGLHADLLGIRLSLLLLILRRDQSLFVPYTATLTQLRSKSPHGILKILINRPVPVLGCTSSLTAMAFSGIDGITLPLFKLGLTDQKDSNPLLDCLG
jgi:hypothetical protein